MRRKSEVPGFKARLCNGWLGLMAFFASAQAWAQKSFDPAPYKIDGGFDNPMSTIAGLTEWSRDINYVYLVTTVIVTGIFFAVAIPLIYTLYRFRAKDGDNTPPKQLHGNAMLEFLWTVIPVVLLIFIAVPTWQMIFKHDGRPVRRMPSKSTSLAISGGGNSSIPITTSRLLMSSTCRKTHQSN